MFKHDDYFMMRYEWYRKTPTNEIKVGVKYGKWTVLNHIIDKNPDWDYDPYAMWQCQCECGRKRQLSSQTLNSSNSAVGCGYCRKYTERDYKRIKDKHYRITYKAWHNLCSRCSNPEHRLYKNYGGRGITVCDEWKKDFNAFYNYVSALEHYGEPGRSIDRIDNDKGYFPGNVRWATAKEQANNQRHRKKKLEV